MLPGLRKDLVNHIPAGAARELQSLDRPARLEGLEHGMASVDLERPCLVVFHTATPLREGRAQGWEFSSVRGGGRKAGDSDYYLKLMELGANRQTGSAFA